MSTPQVKPSQERAQESVQILSKLQGLGVLKNSQGYLALKEQLNTWIRDGPPWQGTIDFVEYDRRAKILLPTKLKAIARCDFLVHKFEH